MNQKTAYPPNFHDIKRILPDNYADFRPVFCYGDTIYNPFELDIPPDVEFHEQVHSSQQGINPESWYFKYLNDKNFRKEQELEAYARQYNFVKKHTNNKIAKECLNEVAGSFASPLYSLGISYGEAESAIRRRAREYAKT